MGLNLLRGHGNIGFNPKAITACCKLEERIKELFSECSFNDSKFIRGLKFLKLEMSNL